MKTQMVRHLDFKAPVKLVSNANLREHWAVKNKRKKEQQIEIMAAMREILQRRKIQLPCTVKITRIGPKALDCDNLANSAKGIRDQIALELGVDDGDTSMVTWQYANFPIGIREYAVRVDIDSL